MFKELVLKTFFLQWLLHFFFCCKRQCQRLQFLKRQSQLKEQLGRKRNLFYNSQSEILLFCYELDTRIGFLKSHLPKTPPPHKKSVWETTFIQELCKDCFISRARLRLFFPRTSHVDCSQILSFLSRVGPKYCFLYRANYRDCCLKRTGFMDCVFVYFFKSQSRDPPISPPLKELVSGTGFLWMVNLRNCSS